jgi:hypothetical protein
VSVARICLHASRINVDAMEAGDHLVIPKYRRDLAYIDVDDYITIQGTLDEMLAVIGRAHEQLLAIQAARAEAAAPARAVLGSDDSLRLETSTGHRLGWLDVGGAQGFEPGDELLIQRDDAGAWSFVRWATEEDAGTWPAEGFGVVAVTAPEDTE